MKIEQAGPVFHKVSDLVIGTVIKTNDEYFMLTDQNGQEQMIHLINLHNGFRDTIDYDAKVTVVDCTLRVNV